MSPLDVATTALTVVLVAFVACGAVPALVTAFQFLVLPLHAWINHYDRAAPYTPRIVVVIPAWNEGLVVGGSIDRLLRLEYPADRLRIVVVDDASTDDTPDVVRERVRRHPGRVVHLRREQGGEGKAHTLNHGIRHVLADGWMEALLIMDADVVYEPTSLRKMARHLADERVGAVTAYIKEGSARKNFLARFIGFEYVLAQLASRRSQSVLGAMACLAGGAQLHSRRNIEDLGGAIDTSSLAEDTVTTFETQLAGRRVVLEPHAIVLAEEPHRIDGLWRQRLRWARGNVQLTRRYRHLWFRPARGHGLGSIAFGLFWFSVFLLPALMIAASVGLIGLYLIDSTLASLVFRSLWIVVGASYVYGMLYGAQLDPQTGRTSWREIILFPGAISLVVMLSAFFPGILGEWLPGVLGVAPSPALLMAIDLASFAWISLCMLAAWGLRLLDRTRIGSRLTPFLTYVVGFGPILCAVTFAAYVAEARGAARTWDKTEKTGRVLG
ncbi:glycosyltransferase [Agrococcus sp. SGAir0287]|uniref:glycosyltransferase n=1 Tax=Agrococcus sp. SGAir0287 TaxID=2070347 RepID=UPI0010CCE93B|nr:glycosyltransferase [Agrococcus sp. SGAir0287]QCR19402.1 glucosaminyltransferase [Agrococcus sp. SGAir0287]